MARLHLDESNVAADDQFLSREGQIARRRNYMTGRCAFAIQRKCGGLDSENVDRSRISALRDARLRGDV
jgi:hypothetical protein